MVRHDSGTRVAAQRSGRLRAASRAFGSLKMLCSPRAAASATRRRARVVDGLSSHQLREVTLPGAFVLAASKYSAYKLFAA
jgi:hypothetical protein